METLLILVGSILLLAAIAGCIIPGLPGPPLGFLALLLQQFRDPNPFTWNFLLLWLLIT